MRHVPSIQHGQMQYVLDEIFGSILFSEKHNIVHVCRFIIPLSKRVIFSVVIVSCSTARIHVPGVQSGVLNGHQAFELAYIAIDLTQPPF